MATDKPGRALIYTKGYVPTDADEAAYARAQERRLNAFYCNGRFFNPRELETDGVALVLTDDARIRAVYKARGIKAEPVAQAAPTPNDATDSAKELAEAHGIDLARVTGTGAGGRITKPDVEALVEGD